MAKHNLEKLQAEGIKALEDHPYYSLSPEDVETIMHFYKCAGDAESIYMVLSTYHCGVAAGIRIARREERKKGKI